MTRQRSALRRLKYFLLFNHRTIGLAGTALLVLLFIVYYLFNIDLGSNFMIPAGTKPMSAERDHHQRIPESNFFKKQIVHLDLKGAAPKPEYLLELFPLFRRMGFTGILMEYEDMFPYSSGLSVLARKSAYNATTIKDLKQAAQKQSLEVIPLIQTFGHMEFALKHREFSALREDPDWMDTICPSKERSIWLIREMFAQIRHLHPTEKSIHIGCDEAWHIGLDEACRTRLNKTFDGSLDRLKLAHISRIARLAKEEFGFEDVFAWNDMFDKISVPLLLEYKLGSLLIPVVWGYNSDVTRPGYFPDGLFERYSRVFEEIYFAGAYKGANGVTQQFVHIDRYMQNLRSYRRLYFQNERYLRNRLTGIILTGWQRFSHTKPLCELLPAGIPALAREAIFLANWTDQKRSKEEIDEQLSMFLDCPQNPSLSASDVAHKGEHFPFLLEAQLSECHFPGIELYDEIRKLNVLRWRAKMERNRNGISGTEEFKKLENEFNAARERITPILSKFYYDDTVKEWLAQHSHLVDFKDDDPMVPRFDPIL